MGSGGREALIPVYDSNSEKNVFWQAVRGSQKSTESQPESRGQAAEDRWQMWDREELDDNRGGESDSAVGRREIQHFPAARGEREYSCYLPIPNML